MDHFTCHSCQHVIGPGDNYYIHGGKAYCKDEYMSKYADHCHGCGMAIMDQYIKVYTPKKQIWHEGCYKTHKRHNPASTAADMPVVDEQEDESASLSIESILNRFEAMVTSCISDSLERLESGSHKKISDGILTLINALGVLFSSIDIVDAVRRKAGKTMLSNSPEIDLLRAKLTDFMGVSLSKTQQTTRSTSSHLKEMYAASSGLSYFMKKVIKIFGEGTVDIDLSAAPDFLNSLHKFPHEPPPATMSFTKTELNRGDAELCQVCNSPISTECVSWDGYLRRQHLACKSSCAQCDACETPQDMNLVLISPPGDSYALCCAVCQNNMDMLGNLITAPDAVMSCKYITKLQQYVFVLRVQFEQLRNPADIRYKYAEMTMTTVTATTTMTTLFERSQKQLDKRIFGRLSTLSHRAAADEPAASTSTSSYSDRMVSDTFGLSTMIGNSYQGLKKGFFSRSKAKCHP
ncbi:hypothetical protein ACJ72_01491 [Emergomyces africanus]|uniref:LIM zinc-binding domain-containing protein n=1 Tax=Emergomyces africanus TaxID=1955775 RepID=A0A1B7P542_9EURO|nr:hypothetical protein ACJ72_01491 [Emergomyces africanus]